MTYGALENDARAIAAHLQSLGLGAEQRVVLLFPPGLPFITAFFGILLAGAAAVPAYPPHPARLTSTLPPLQALLANARPAAVLSTSAIQSAVASAMPLPTGVVWATTDDIATAPADWRKSSVSGESIALVQYTSGSTAAPKGVLLSHRNLLRNSATICRAFAHSRESRGVIWLPPYHDMGLIGGIIQPLFAGFPVTLMSPASFLMRPLRWLETISRAQATTSGGPNFAFDLCVRKTTPEQRAQLDLRSWRVAFVGAEPVRRETLGRFAEAFAPAGFRAEAFYPCYGLAESTLFVTGGGFVPAVNIEAQAPVSCGTPAPGVELQIVDPENATARSVGETGEVWLRSESIAHGYFDQPEETQRAFHTRLAEEPGDFLRTGDLGFVQNGELFLTGRLKNLIIIGGRNHYGEDIEQTVERSSSTAPQGGCAAFSVDLDGEERLIVALEVDRHFARSGPEEMRSAAGALREAIRRAVAERHDLRAQTILLLSPASLPRTTSGKVQRHLCRRAYLAGKLHVLAEI